MIVVTYKGLPIGECSTVEEAEESIKFLLENYPWVNKDLIEVSEEEE